MLETLTSTWKVARQLRRRANAQSGPPRFTRRTTRLWGHGKALLDDPGGLLAAARSQLGPLFALELPEATLAVIGGEAGRALASRPRPLGQPRFLLAGALDGELRWQLMPTPAEADRRAAEEIVTAARSRAPIERAARALAQHIASWPRRGELLPLLEQSLPTVLAATLAAPGRADDAATALARISGGSCQPAPLSPWPSMPWRRDPADRLYPQLARDLRPLATDRRRKRREAPSLLGALSAELGPLRAARIGAWIVGATWQSALAELRATLARPIEDELLEELLEEHDLLHGDQGDVTFESATRSVTLSCHLERALDAALAAPSAWQLARLEADLRVQGVALREGQWLLSPFVGGRRCSAPGTSWLHRRWTRPLIQALWSVLLREIWLDHEGALVHYRRRS